ncbi:DUF1573 domain-containing protein [Pedobacter punctiformis]|uniref:DUF1573 domain-containing protein n=1 Tax=Pedobacter punctiformis TaxID=3004097 RepID=A0ABT4LAE9_9SPHI|nr:DUF1573 domain-containing protein [Pedobacter sp. HCMS5-2]MCZ4244879.1 DUF1573 domain-containing protein [Pedobacter sp. HCMS5-2]
MKKIFILAIAALSFTACHNANNQTKEESTGVSIGNDTSKTASKIAPADAAVISFDREIYDFEKIQQGEKVQHDFKFKNTGKSPLIITNATATCGCTIPESPKEPILPGKEGVIKVVFNSEGKFGMQDKIVTVTSNANPNVSTVHLVGEVLAKK